MTIPLAFNQDYSRGRSEVKLRRFAGFILLVLFSLPAYSQTGTSAWVQVGTNGRLQYTPDAKGNTIPDFSRVGYQFGDQSIPNVPVVKTITPVSGDNRAHIQAAIDEVAALPVGSNGFRGAVLLKAGEYGISNQVNITASGVVLRGEGTSSTSGTRLVATGNIQYTLFNVAGSASPVETAGTRVKVTDSYVPVGAKSFNVLSSAGFAVGDKIILRVEPKDSWITLIGTASYGWTADAYNMSYLREITGIVGNKVFLDAPVVDMIDVNYKDAYIYHYTWNKIENVGFESIRFSSVYDSLTDELHGWSAISLNYVQHGWVRNSDFYHYGYSAVYIKDWGANISVLNCRNFDPISETTGGRKYSFNLNGQLCLVKDCSTDKGRHDYVTGSTTAGPNAFVNSTATNMKADIGPHHRWATGLLFDNITGNGEQNVQNRGTSGSGHGWAGAQTVFWNCTSSRFRVQMPSQHLNWAIGCKGIVTDDGNYVDGNPGIWESTGNAIGAIPSLYDKQLSDRLSSACLPASASADDGNVPANVLDGNLVTRWSANGDGHWIQFCLGNTENVNGVKIAFYLGDARVYNFDISTSLDGTNFTSAATNVSSSGTSLNLQAFNFTARQAKYVRIIGHGSSANTWNSFTEAEVLLQAQNVAPSVSITSPANNATFVAPASVTINANASDTDGTISKVEFFQGSTKLGEDLTSPYSFTWSNVAAGNYNLSAKATDNDGTVTTSAVVAVVVNANQAPSVSITSPANGATYTAPASVTIDANASDSDGSVAKVEFFQGTTKLGEDTSSPYSFSWTNVAAGSYSLTAKATDNGGAVTTSAAISITVNAAPVQSPYLGTVRNIPGKIEAEHYDLGGQGISYNDNTAGNSGNSLRTDDVDVQVTTDVGGGNNIGFVTAGEWMEYTVNVNTAGIYNLELRVAATSTGRSLHVELDGQDISGSVAVPNTGAYQTFQTVTITTPVLAAGQKVMRIVLETAGFNLNYVNFVLVQSPYGGSVRNIPGKIEAEHYDLGGAGIAYNDATVGNSGNIFRTDDVDVQATSDTGGGYNIGYVAAGDWMEYLVNVTSSGTYTLEVRVAATATGKTFHVELNGVNISGAIAVPNTGSYQVFQTVSVTTPSLSSGLKVLRIVMDSPSFNLNYVNFAPSGPLMRVAEDALLSDEKSLSMDGYPNPFKDEAVVKFYLKEEGETSIVVYDAMGRRQSVVTEKRLPAGTHYETIRGNELPAGLYIVKLTHNRESAVLKMNKK